MIPKFACADFTFPLLGHHKVLDLIALLEFDGVDIGLFEGRSHLWPSLEFSNISKNAQNLKTLLEERQLKVADIFLQTADDFTSTAINHPDNGIRTASRETFQKTIEYTEKLGGKHVSILPGVYFDQEAESKSWKRCVEELKWRLQIASDAGITFAIEAHIGSIVPTPEDVLRLIKELPNLSLTLDFTHFTKMGIPDQRVEPLISHASHFHARGAALGQLQTILSENTIDYPRIAEIMKETHYNGFIGIEYVWLDWENCNRVDNISESIQLRALLKKSF